ncbi:hypothetical protein OAK53_00975, partial [bacterium]|nr:hypothetical protein [bacterium]
TPKTPTDSFGTLRNLRPRLLPMDHGLQEMLHFKEVSSMGFLPEHLLSWRDSEQQGMIKTS